MLRESRNGKGEKRNIVEINRNTIEIRVIGVFKETCLPAGTVRKDYRKIKEDKENKGI